MDHARSRRRGTDDDRDADEEHARRRGAETRVILRVGLTGGIASGKSTIARVFEGLGSVVVDADAIVARLYLRGNAGHEALVNAYDAEILRADGEIDRQKLADAAFAS